MAANMPRAELVELARRLVKPGRDGASLGDLLEWQSLKTKQAVIDQLAAHQADGWQPIWTAPQDGRTILLGYFNALGKWRTVRGQWFTDAVIQEEWTHSDVHEAGWFETSAECDEEDSGCWPTDPTHWMPLPKAPPIPSNGGAGGAL